MMDSASHKYQVESDGFTIIDNIYSALEVEKILAVINAADLSNDRFRKSSDLYAIRHFLNEIPESVKLIFNDKLKSVVNELFDANFFVVKSIYFDKPELSNWYVAYHQDLTISVDKRLELPGFVAWTKKQNQFAVQPPIEILQNIFTLRIHLDDTSIENGALKVIPKSHLKNIVRVEKLDFAEEQICEVFKGGVMIMKPLLMHSSGRSISGEKRRVIHIEFSNLELPEEINWSERLNLN